MPPWMRIAARGLTHQVKTAITGRAVGTMSIQAVDEKLEARAVITPYASGRDRPNRPAENFTSRAQATRDTLPGQVIRPGRPAFGGMRHNGPAAATRGTPGPGREHDQHPRRTPPAPGARGGTRRRIPPARSRHPTTTGNDPSHPIYGIT